MTQHPFPTRPQLPHALLHALAQTSTQQLSQILDDLLTPQEIEAIAERWHIADQLRHGLSQRQIAHDLNVSVTTVSRGNRQLKYGNGGFALAFALAAQNTERGDG